MSNETEIRPFQADMADEAIADLRMANHGYPWSSRCLFSGPRLDRILQ